MCDSQPRVVWGEIEDRAWEEDRRFWANLMMDAMESRRSDKHRLANRDYLREAAVMAGIKLPTTERRED